MIQGKAILSSWVPNRNHRVIREDTICWQLLWRNASMFIYTNGRIHDTYGNLLPGNHDNTLTNQMGQSVGHVRLP